MPTGGAIWAAASTAVSACVYLFDFVTTLSTLRTYFYYEYQCPHVSLTSTLLRDRICQAIRSGHSLHNSFIQFWVCLSFLAVAHITYGFIFWVTLDARHHPLRLAYFMPIIHLYRLLKVLWRTFSCKGVTELQESQREPSSLYNALGASLETAPQFVVQFVIAMKLGQSVENSSNPAMHAQRIPTNLMLSLVASLVAGSFATSTAVFFSIGKERMPLAKIACVCILAGCQTFVVMVLQATLAASLAQFSDYGSFTLLIYMTMTVIIAWSFSSLLLRSNYRDCQGKTRFLLKVAHSLGIALVFIFIGPIYLIVKFGKSSCWLIWATILHIFGELIGVSLVLIRVGFIKDRESPCHSHHMSSIEEEENKYLSCNVFLGTIFPSLFIFIIMSMLLVWVRLRSDNARYIQKEPLNTMCNSHSKLTLSLVSNQSLKKIEKKTSQHRSMSTFFRNFLFVLLFHSIWTHKKYGLKLEAAITK